MQSGSLDWYLSENTLIEKFLLSHKEITDLFSASYYGKEDIVTIDEDLRWGISEDYLTIINRDALSRQGSVYDSRLKYEDLGSTLVQSFGAFNDIEENISFSVLPRYMYYPTHAHGHMEMLFVYKGQCALRFGEKHVRLKEKDLIITSAGVPHALGSLGHDDIVVYCGFKQSYFSDRVTDPLINNDWVMNFIVRSFVKTQKRQDFLLFEYNEADDMDFLIQRAFEEYRSKRLSATEAIDAYIGLLFIKMFRRYANYREEFDESLPQETKVSKIITYISDNYDTVTLQSLSKHFSFDPAYLSRLLKKTTGSRFKTNTGNIKLFFK